MQNLFLFPTITMANDFKAAMSIMSDSPPREEPAAAASSRNLPPMPGVDYNTPTPAERAADSHHSMQNTSGPMGASSSMPNTAGKFVKDDADGPDIEPSFLDLDLS